MKIAKDVDIVIHNNRPQVMTRLGLTVEQRLTWPEAEAKIRARLYPEDVNVICKECRWLPLGYCTEGLKDLMDRL